MTALKRVACFVDGFNLYHAIDDLSKMGKPRHYLKWLDLHKLTKAFVRPATEVVADVHYFSAYATWLPDAHQRHQQYVAALQSVGVTVKLGQFKQKSRSCRQCGANWVGHEEKESDVNFAVELLNRAWHKEFDRAIIVTADTDIVPVLQMVKRDHPSLHLTAAIPEQRYGNALALRDACHGSLRIKEAHLLKSLFSASVVDGSGNVLATRPQKYNPPKTVIV
ncbi:MAG: NYN domain-containing protein [Dechloromonas sp.]|nr:NYN domain-containing protein [Dechloromonas sp.]